ncbi:MAG: PAS domain S-box protein [Bacteroidota bacterium]|nr:PAS domain S-box protein [Bacteroidota bacterium]
MAVKRNNGQKMSKQSKKFAALNNELRALNEECRVKNEELLLANRKLEESSEMFEAFAKQSIEGITVADLEGNYVFVNQAFCEMSGYTEEELLSLTVFDMKAESQPHTSFF